MSDPLSEGSTIDDVTWPPPTERRVRLLRATVALTAAVGAVVLLVQAPRSDAASPETNPVYESVLLEGVPHVRQKPDYCGEACAESWLRALGLDLDQDDVFAKTGVDPALHRGAWTRELKVGLQAVGFRVGDVWHQVSVARLASELESQWAALHADLVRGVPSIICTRYDDESKTTEHFRLILGYDAATDEVLYHEPAEDDGAYRRMDRSMFLSIWPLKYDPKQWTVIRFALEPGPGLTKGTTAPRDPVEARAQELRDELPDSFTVLSEPPFVVVGDEDPATVRRHSQGTVRWATRLLKRQYFDRDPDEVWTIWLFKDRRSYTRHALTFFGDTPDTPFGYATETHHALVMNIATGGGTLVHEMVHPFVDANVPGAPPWINEGLASLYEACREQDGRIVGMLNWRLEGLQDAIRRGPLPSFQTLSEQDVRGFYERDPGTHYGQARYLLYYLQEQGLLASWWSRWTADFETDPTGYATLQAVLGADDMAVFQADWEAWILGLEYE
jgi:hypothetical protein